MSSLWTELSWPPVLFLCIFLTIICEDVIVVVRDMCPLHVSHNNQTSSLASCVQYIC